MFALVRIDPFDVLRTFTDATPPNPLAWPNGDITYAASPGEERVGCRLVAVEHRIDAPNEFYDCDTLVPSLEGSTLYYDRQWKPRELAGVKAQLKARIDRAAENARLSFITDGAGQALIYQGKLTEATALQSDSKPDPMAYPLLAAAIGIQGETLSDVAALVLAKAKQWAAAGAQIEKVRLGGKATIDAASTVDAAAEAFAAIKWE